MQTTDEVELQSICMLLTNAVNQLRELYKTSASEEEIFEIELGLDWTISRIRTLLDRMSRHRN